MSTATEIRPHPFESDTVAPRWCKVCNYGPDAYVHAAEDARRDFDEQRAESLRAALAAIERDTTWHTWVSDEGRLWATVVWPDGMASSVSAGSTEVLRREIARLAHDRVMGA